MTMRSRTSRTTMRSPCFAEAARAADTASSLLSGGAGLRPGTSCRVPHALLEVFPHNDRDVRQPRDRGMPQGYRAGAQQPARSLGRGVRRLCVRVDGGGLVVELAGVL